MKSFAQLLLLFMSLPSFAGHCRLEFNSQELGRVNFMTINVHSVEVGSLEACVKRAQSMLGMNYRARTFVRDEVRKLTSAKYHFAGRGLVSTGTIQQH